MHNKFTISSLIKIGSEKLQNAGINNYKNESQWLLLDILKKNSTWIYSNQDHTVSLKTSNIYFNNIYLRSNHIPFQVVLGYASFYGRDFMIYPDVFIPRQESEVLIDYIKKKNLKQHLK